MSSLRKKSNMQACLIFLLALFAIAACSEQDSRKGDSMGLERDPAVIGERVANNVMSRPFGWRYQKACTYYGALLFAEASGNKEITEKVEAGFAPYYSGKKKYRSGHVDFNVFGIWPLELHRQTGKEDYLTLGLALADDEYKDPPRADGLSDLTRYWVDDMYMVGSLQVQAYREMMRGLLAMQGNSGMWHQLLDNHESFEEPSCTGMFLFSMITGDYHGQAAFLWASAAMLRFQDSVQ